MVLLNLERLKNLQIEFRGSSKRKNKRTPGVSNITTESYFSFDPIDSRTYAIPNSSPLFQLPREIRDKIWQYVLAENLIHIGNPSTEKITHIVCRALISDRLVHSMYPFENLDPVYWDNYRKKLPPGQSTVDYRIRDKRLRDHNFRHSFCFAESWKFAKATKLPYTPYVQEAIQSAQLSLTLMRTCRAIYVETFRLLWSRNTFGFAKSHTIADFMRARTTLQRDSLRHLALKPENTIQLPFRLQGQTFSEAFGSRHRSSLWCQALKLLPNLASVYLTASFDLSMEQTEDVWCRGELKIPIPPGVRMEIVDDLADKKTLVDFCLHVEGVETYIEEGGDFFAACRCNELRDDLERLMQLRVMGRRSPESNRRQIESAANGIATSRLELSEQELSNRKKTWEDWKGRGIEDNIL